jgi:hypothetical protein
MRTETSGGGYLCEQDWAEECEEKAEHIEQERSSALSRDEIEIYDEVIRNYPKQWPTEQGQGGREEDLEWIEGGDAMEFTIGRVNEKDTEGSEGEHCNLWTLLGADDERVPERDPWDLGLELESPDIQRWADEKGWTETIRDTVEFDKGWSEMESEDEAVEKSRRKTGRLQKRQKKTTAPRTIRNVKGGV